ncbi:MipA/OmpV family protein [Paraburkholderia sp. BCC1884]|uniref:MipA/OmpV family protein n=1 Tax=Paraburkholderia sp. BCC1884 TaxID=2562668 RepID=UPI001642C32B|nr:MipA/OmpV family protein [Paraburkholderia sp. BCC1884]
MQHRHEGLALIFKRAAAARWRALRGACGLVSIGMATLVLTTPGARANPSPTTLGIGIAVAPRYEGSSTFHLEPFPILSASRGIFFIDGLDGGIAIPLGGNLKTGLVLSTQFGRDQSDGDRLNGLGDIDTTAAFGPFLDWHPGAFDASLKFFQSLHSGYGATLTLDTKYKFQLSERDSVTVGNSATWASRSSQQTFFGVTPGQAANSEAGLPAYSPSAGFRNVGTSATWVHLLNRHWSVDSTLRLDRLLGDAKNSPVVEHSTSLFGGIGGAYTF